MDIQLIQEKIYLIRGYKVMLDFDLAFLYGVETKRLKEAVRRNRERFPDDFMFQLSEKEYQFLRTQFASLKIGEGRGKHSKYMPYAFTEQGVAMLSGVLHSDTAVDMHISIMRAFIAMRRFLYQYHELSEQISKIRETVNGQNEQLSRIYDVIESLLDEKAEQRSWQDRERIGFKP